MGMISSGDIFARVLNHLTLDNMENLHVVGRIEANDVRDPSNPCGP